MNTAFYPGSFDPMTNGHLDVLVRALGLAARVVVGIGINPAKPGLFAFDDRARLVRDSVAQSLPGAGSRLDVVEFSGLAVDAARKHGATLIIRGLRDGTDLDYEMQMAGMNATMAPDIQTVFLPASPASRHITATLVRQISAMGGDVAPFVPAAVLAAMAARQKT